MKDVQDYYDSTAEDEYTRLAPDRPLHYQLEFERTIEQISDYLPEEGHILDAGGGAGRYTEWLVDHGYQVTLLDLSREQLQKAKENCDTNSVTFCQGSITDLPLKSSQFDAVLCTGGPLSHIISDSERKSALREFQRVSKENIPLFVSVMGLLNALRSCVHGLPEFDVSPILPKLVQDGKYTLERAEKLDIDDSDDFTECKFFRAKEFRAMLEEAGISVTNLIGLESITHGIDGSISEMQEKNIRETVDKLEDTDTVADMSPHMLAVGRM